MNYSVKDAGTIDIYLEKNGKLDSHVISDTKKLQMDKRV